MCVSHGLWGRRVFVSLIMPPHPAHCFPQCLIAHSFWQCTASLPPPHSQRRVQESHAAEGSGTAAATTTGRPGGPPFSLRLCNAKGEPMLWGGSFDKEIDPQHQREFLCMFSEACALPDGAPGAGPYAAEALDSPDEHESLLAHRQRAAAGPQPVALEDCMRVFLQPERLDESDAWWVLAAMLVRFGRGWAGWVEFGLELAGSWGWALMVCRIRL